MHVSQSNVMKRILLSLVLILSGILSNAQIKPPQQTDTLIITSVKYNFAEIREENWPCSVIYKSTTSFTIGEDVFTILEASKSLFDVEFLVTDKEKTETYTLIYNDYHEDILVKFSGYEFKCRMRHNSPTLNYTANVKLAGRSVNGTLPTFSSDKAGKIIVQIWVDNYGSVQKAIAGAEGTTVTDKELCEQARKAALNAHFNMSADAPVMQEGVIIFENEHEDTKGASEEYQELDVKPSFQGGDANHFASWVNHRLVYPKKAKKNGIQGRVTLSFTIAKDGTVKDVNVVRGVDEDLDKEAVRVVSSSPKWKPGQKDGEPVAVTYTFPVIFQTR